MNARRNHLKMKKSFIVVFISLIFHTNVIADSNVIGLSQAYKMALAHEAKLKSIGYQVGAKEEDVKQTESQLYPQIFSTLNNVNRNYKEPTAKSNVREGYNSASISASQAIYHPEILTQIDSAKLQVDAARVSLNKEEQDLAYKVADAYISMLKYKNGISVAESYVKTSQVKYQQISEKLDLQLSNKMDLYESRLAYEQAKIILHKQEQLFLLSKLKLKNLIGVDIEDTPIIDFDVINTESLIPFTKKQDLTDNPDIKMGRITTDIYQKEVQTAKFGHYPKLDLVVSHTKYSSNDKTVDYEYDSKIMVEFKIPLYQGGKVEAQVQKNQFLLNSARESLIDQERSVKEKYDELLLNYEASKETIVMQREAKNSAELYLHAIQKGYDHGLKSLIDLEDAKTKLYESKFKLIDAVYTMIDSYIGILGLTGRLEMRDIENLNRLLFTNN